MPSHYSVLGVNENATDNDIKKAYRELCMKYHPDLAKSKETTNSERFKQISAAHAILSDTKSRKLYDFELEESQRFGFNRRTAGSTSGFESGGGIRNREKMAGNTQLHALYKPRNIVLGLIGLSTVVLLKSYFTRDKEKSHHYNSQTGNKAMVEAWKNPETGHWETPAPWSEKYRQLKPTIHLIHRDEVRKTRK